MKKMSDGKTGSLWGCERIHGHPGGPEEPGSNTVTHIFTGVLVPSFTVPNRVQPRTDNAVLGIGQVLPVRPHLTIPVANTETFPTVDSNNEVDFITYCEVLQTKAETLAEDLQTLYNEKIAAAVGGGGGGGGGVSEGVGNSCEEDFEIKANTFVINCNAMVVDQCGTPPPVNFNCGSFTVTLDSTAETFTVTDGTSTISLNNGTLTFSGITTLDLPAITTIGGTAIATETYADAAAAAAQSAAESYADDAAADAAAILPQHRHTYEGDGNTATTEYTGYAGTP